MDERRRLHEQSKRLQLKAKKGDNEAQVELGDLFQYAGQDPRSLEYAISLYRQAANAGDMRGQLKLAGMLKEYGQRPVFFESEFIHWYRKAAEAGSPEAQCELGTALVDGDGARMNKRAGAELIREAAVNGLAEAQARLGSLLEREIGVAADKGEAHEWYKRAAKQGHHGAELNLGIDAETGERKDLQKAEYWYRRSAAGGNKMAQLYLGNILWSKGTREDRAEAAKWYRASAENGSPKARVYFAMALDEQGAEEWGTGRIAPAETKFHYHKAAEEGNAEAAWLVVLRGWVREETARMAGADSETARAFEEDYEDDEEKKLYTSHERQIKQSVETGVFGEPYAIARKYRAAVDEGLATGALALGLYYWMKSRTQKEVRPIEEAFFWMSVGSLLTDERNGSRCNEQCYEARKVLQREISTEKQREINERARKWYGWPSEDDTDQPR